MNHRIKKEHSYVRFWWLFSSLAAMIFVRYGLQIGIPRVLALIPIVTIALLGNQTEIIAICMCLIPFHESLDFYYALVLVIAIYVIRCHDRIKINASVFPAFLIVIWELLHCFNGDFSPRILITSLSPTIALVIILCSDFTDLDYAFVVRAVAMAALVTCLSMLAQVAWISRFNLTAFMLNLRRLGALDEASKDRLQITGGLVQTNSLGVICVIVTACLLQLRAAAQSKKSDKYIMLTLLIFGTLTASRTFLVCLLLMIFLVFLGQKGGKKKLQYLGIAALMGCFVVIILVLFFPDQLEYYISRFFESDITTGRDDLMVNYHRFITKNLDVMFFGIGLQNYGEKLTVLYRVASNVPHNCVQEIVVAWGIPGLLLVILLILQLFYRNGRSMERRSILNYIPLIIVLFKSVAGQLLTSNYTMLALAFAYISLIQNLSEDLGVAIHNKGTSSAQTVYTG